MSPQGLTIQALHMAINPDVFAAHLPLQIKVIFLADIKLGSNQLTAISSQATLNSRLKQEIYQYQNIKLALEATVSSPS
jgi:hypothetical protein